MPPVLEKLSNSHVIFDNCSTQDQLDDMQSGSWSKHCRWWSGSASFVNRMASERRERFMRTGRTSNRDVDGEQRGSPIDQQQNRAGKGSESCPQANEEHSFGR